MATSVGPDTETGSDTGESTRRRTSHAVMSRCNNLLLRPEPTRMGRPLPLDQTYSTGLRESDETR